MILPIALVAFYAGWFWLGGMADMQVVVPASNEQRETAKGGQQASHVSLPATMSLKSDFRPAATGIRALTLQFLAGQCRIVDGGSLHGKLKVPRYVGGCSGLYHRVVNDAGQVVFENLVPDPRVAHYDYSTDGRTLAGGVAVINDTPVALRLPADVTGRLEVFLAKSASTAPRLQARAETMIASFDL